VEKRQNMCFTCKLAGIRCAGNTWCIGGYQISAEGMENSLSGLWRKVGAYFSQGLWSQVNSWKTDEPLS